MRIQVILDSSAGALTVHAEGYSTATPPTRLAATLASIVEAALTEPAPPAQPSPAAQQPPIDQPSVDAACPAAPAVDQRPAPALTTRPMAEAPAVRPVATKLVAPGVVAEVVPDVPAGDSGRDGPLRRAALQLLDDGLTDDQVCAQLGISRSRLLRWDDPDGEFLPPLVDSLAAVIA